MVDLATMHALEAALSEKARLIVMGDKDQLASVESGAVMADLHDAANVPGTPLAGSLVTLDKSHRFSKTRGIGRLAEAINRQDPDAVFRALGDKDDKETALVEVTGAEAMQRTVESLARLHIVPALREPDPLRRRTLLGDFAVLAAHREGWFGQSGLNRFIEAILEREGLILRGREWYPGRPIMVTENDYHTRLFNGDIGLIVPAEENDEVPVALFTGPDGSERLVPTSRLPRCETAFAMTVHKSQGSEFNRVAVVLPERRSQVVTRELLYTACSRARKSVTFIGTDEVIREAVLTPCRRTSGLRAKLVNT